MNNIDNKNLVITRKRKKWKFAHFEQYNNCFDFGQFVSRSDANYNSELLANSATEVISYFDKVQPVVVELAAGNAQFSLELARQNRDKNYIAIDIKADRLYTSAKAALEEDVSNIAFVRLQLSMVGLFFSQTKIDLLWLTFPDPRPKKGDQKLRLTHSDFLEQYRSILSPNGRLLFKTDNKKLFEWSLEQFKKEGWDLLVSSRDLHRADLPSHYKIMTHYELKYHGEGYPIYFAELSADQKKS